MKKKFFTSKNIAFLAVLVALIIVLQLWGGYVKIGVVNFSFTLIPIVLGAIMLGPAAGAFLGFAFGLIVLINGIIGSDAFTFYLFSDVPVFTVVLCIVKGVAAGFVSGLLFKFLKNKNKYAAVFVAAAAAPIVNTGLFIAGGFMISKTLSALSGGKSVAYFLIIQCAGINFLVEFALNLILAPALFRVIKLFMKDSGDFIDEKNDSKTQTEYSNESKNQRETQALKTDDANLNNNKDL